MLLCSVQAVQAVTSLLQATISQSIVDWTANYTTDAQLQRQTTQASLAVRMLLYFACLATYARLPCAEHTLTTGGRVDRLL